MYMLKKLLNYQVENVASVDAQVFLKTVVRRPKQGFRDCAQPVSRIKHELEFLSHLEFFHNRLSLTQSQT